MLVATIVKKQSKKTPKHKKSWPQEWKSRKCPAVSSPTIKPAPRPLFLLLRTSLGRDVTSIADPWFQMRFLPPVCLIHCASGLSSVDVSSESLRSLIPGRHYLQWGRIRMQTVKALGCSNAMPGLPLMCFAISRISRVWAFRILSMQFLSLQVMSKIDFLFW